MPQSMNGWIGVAACAALAMGMAVPVADGQDAIAIEVVVSPATLVLSAPGTSVHAHTDIAFGLVDGDTVGMNGLTPVAVFPDNRGQLVAKFDRDQVKALCDGSTRSLRLTLTGGTLDAQPFAGTDTIRVKP